ncbi:MAG TPA: hypothetical protein VN704_11960 [Verrucomicrobiae bacterium]|nr:hypothetical protein [Verrucomicrobiae bacterium]
MFFGILKIFINSSWKMMYFRNILNDASFNDSVNNITIGVTILEKIFFNKDFMVIGLPRNDLV